MGKTISGRVIADEVLDGVTAEVEQLKAKGIHPSLAVILVGDDNASQVYVNNKRKACERVGIVSHIYTRGADTTQEDLMALVEELNAREDIHGILCQSPIPRHLDEKAVINAISQDKDVDAFHPLNVGHIMIGDCRFLPCTPAGVMEMLHHEQVKIEGAHCVVIGRSNIVGKPMAMLMLKESATVTVCHSKTPDLRAITSQADILISAVGKAKFVGADMVKPGAVVIDVGMNRDENNKLCGDVDFDAVAPIADKITPVPGGVGLMTVAMLMRNTVTAAKLLNGMA